MSDTIDLMVFCGGNKKVKYLSPFGNFYAMGDKNTKGSIVVFHLKKSESVYHTKKTNHLYISLIMSDTIDLMGLLWGQ